MHTETSNNDKAEARYIVLLHRRDKDGQVVGVVESIENSTRRAFIDRDELWAILMRVDPRISKSNRSVTCG